MNHDKAEVLKDIEYNSHTSICLELLNKWKKDSSTNTGNKRRSDTEKKSYRQFWNKWQKNNVCVEF